VDLRARFQQLRDAERVNRQLKQKLATHTLPDVMEYVNETAALSQLQKTVKSWERKTNVASVSRRIFY